MICPSLVTITPEPSEFCTIASSFGLRNWRGLRKKNSNGSRPYCRRTAIFFDVFTLTTEGMTFETSVRRSRLNCSSVPISLRSTGGAVASEYFSGVALVASTQPAMLHSVIVEQRNPDANQHHENQKFKKIFHQLTCEKVCPCLSTIKSRKR